MHKPIWSQKERQSTLPHKPSRVINPSASNAEGYFCNLRSQWQRGSNENTICLLSKYLPEKPAYLYIRKKLGAIARQLNERRLQGLQFTPAEKFAEYAAPIS